MFIELLAYTVLGMLLTKPAWRLLRWLGQRTGLWPTRLQYLRPYVPAARRPVVTLEKE